MTFHPSTFEEEEIILPPPRLKSDVSLEEALTKRHSLRLLTAEPRVSIDAIGQLLWAADGFNHSHQKRHKTSEADLHRTSPSAGALYPLSIFVVFRQSAYLYHPREHVLTRHVLWRHTDGDLLAAVTRAGRDQIEISMGSCCFVIVCDFSVLAPKYGDRAERYGTLEAGHACQNMLLQAAALHLAAVPIGAFHDGALRTILQLSENVRPLYLIPAGLPQK